MRMLIDPPNDPFQEMLGLSTPPAKPDVDKALEILENHSNEIPVMGVRQIKFFKHCIY
jgi:hypothetical protein